jgi:hypothetical protein
MKPPKKAAKVGTAKGSAMANSTSLQRSSQVSSAPRLTRAVEAEVAALAHDLGSMIDAARQDVGSDRAKEQRFDPADLFVTFVERLAIPPKTA